MEATVSNAALNMGERSVIVDWMVPLMALIRVNMSCGIACLTGFRFVAGLAGASGIVISLAVARDLYSGIALARCVSLLMTVVKTLLRDRGYGLSPQQFGYALGANALGLAATSLVNGRLVKRVAPRTLLGVGVTAIGFSAVGPLLVTLAGGGLMGILPALFLITASLGFIAPNANALALTKVEARAAGTASAMLGFLQFSIGAVSAPIFGMGGVGTAIPMAVGIALFGTLARSAIFALRPAPESVALDAR